MASADDQLRRLIGQLFIVGFHSQTADENIKKLIRAPYFVGQIVLFQRNVSDADQLRRLTAELQQVAQDAGHEHPLTIGIDQENGLVTRIQPPITAQLPGSMALGATAAVDDAYNVGRATGRALRAFGINMNYAPVCDVNSNPSNPVIGVRSFSDDPNAVARLAAANLNGLRDEGVIPCVKHFPGHGDTAVDSHYGLPVIQRSWADMEQCELVPFRRAVAEQVPAVMTAHIVIGDSKLPATLDAAVLRSLRDDLKFAGVIVSDCLEMNAIRTECGGTVKGAITALQSGCDSVMICHTIDLQTGALEAVFDQAKKDSAFRHQLQESHGRVSLLNQDKFTLDSEKSGRLAYASFGDLATVNEHNSQLAARLYAKSTTAVRQQPGLLPLNRTQRIVFVSPGEKPVASGVVESGEVKTRVPHTPPDFIDVLKSYNAAVEELRFYEDGSNADEILRAAGGADAVILATRNARLAQYQRTMALKLASNVQNLVVVATCDPYDFLEDDVIKTYLTIYEPTSSAFKAAADVLFGATAAQGTLPVQQAQPATAVEPFAPERDMDQVCSLWHEVLPGYQVPKPHLSGLLKRPQGNHFVIRDQSSVIGFIATHIQPPPPSKPSEHPKGLITAVLVHPHHQSKGVGTALLNHTRTLLLSHNCHSLAIGSTFPRFFPGLPTDIAASHQTFFHHRGFSPALGSATARGDTARDLHIDLAADVPNAGATARLAAARSRGLSFRPWTRGGEAECLARQRANFGAYAGWVEGYEALARAGLHGQVMVAHDAGGAQVAWTMMLEPGTPVFLPDLAFPPLLGGSTGLVACVGVDGARREGGVGLALVAAALEELKRRGVERCFIDWVTLVGWYEKLGLKTWREYQTMEWRAAGNGAGVGDCLERYGELWVMAVREVA
ncbi:hypothetical protein GTA08_BOTSDO04817 [Neofusicoccum parvum]|nr:hypothetical protein GTA08_BOTSDO04817 [Neofusicoccum parvum]